jgi:hypothetical protein
MRRPAWLIGVIATLSLALALVPAADDKKPEPAKKAGEITWKKTVLDKVFRSEGVAVADINRDGKMDIINGECWYEAPDWKRHEIRKQGNYGDGSASYSNCMACWTEDINGDGWPDLIVVGFPGAPCHWFENPKGKEGHWKQHEIWHSACNETPLYVDLFGNGKRVLVMGWQPKGKDNQGQMAYFTPGKDPTKTWEMHPISAPSTPDKITSNTYDLQGTKVTVTVKIHGTEIPGTFRFSHGLGAGDVNGDGRMDVICPAGWWEQPAKPDGKTPWKFHPAALGDACADMFTYDVDGDGKADIISSSAHNYGIWWFQQKPGAKGAAPTFIRRDLFPKLVSQTHALHCVDINGDGYKDLVTGKRWWAHGPRGDADPNAAAKVFWFEAKKGKDGITSFKEHVIDDDSGIGTQFAVADVNGDKLLDVVTSNKKGTFLFEQVREKK